MRLTRRAALLALVLFLALSAAPAPAAAPGNAADFMRDLGNRVLELINGKGEPEAARKKKFHDLADQSFEVNKIAQFVLGRYWRNATDQEKKQFEDAFETYMISVYWSRFTGYNGETFKVMGQRDLGNDGVEVQTQFVRSGGQPPVKVSWWVVKSGDGFKIRDASLEGVSQAQTYRDEFASIIERNGGKISALIQQLNERSKG